jgi:hypothetical protein
MIQTSGLKKVLLSMVEEKNVSRHSLLPENGGHLETKKVRPFRARLY